MCGFVFVNTGADGDLEFKAVVTCLPWMLGINLGSTAKKQHHVFLCVLRDNV